MRRWIILFLLLLVSPVNAAPTTAPTTAPVAGPMTAPARVVQLVTLGPGDEVWERFGHVMLDIHDPSRHADLSLNWGIFDFDQPGFVWHFIQGRMLYTMDAFRPGWGEHGSLYEYRQLDRAITIQTIPMTDVQYERLFRHIYDNLQDGHRDYRYDYFRDNCSTRVRDALDIAFGGEIKARLEKLPADPPTTYRAQTRRLMQDDFWLALGTNFIIGPGGDEPLSAWEDCFVPMQMAKYLAPWAGSTEHPWVSQRPPEHQEVPDYTWWMGAIGIIGASGAVAGMMSRRRVLRVSGWVLISLWMLLSGLGGVLMLLFWTCTDHRPTYANENLLAYSPLAIVLLVCLAWRRLRGWRWLPWLAAAIVGFTVIEILGKCTPWFIQRNGQFLALALPMNAALWWIVRSKKERAV